MGIFDAIKGMFGGAPTGMRNGRKAFFVDCARLGDEKTGRRLSPRDQVAILNALARIHEEEGFDMEEFHGGAPCEEDDNYRNQITAAYNITALLIKRGLLDVSEMDKGLPGEGELFKQLTTRKNEIDDRGKLRIQPKEKYKKEGYHSPDRADSFCMAVYWAWLQSGGWDGLFSYESDNGEQTPERATRTMAQEVEDTLIAPHDEDILVI